MEVIHHKHILYNLDTVKSSMIIVEGIFDVWRIGDGAVASFGITYTLEQIILITLIKPSRVFIMFDSEPQAQRNAEKLGSALSSLGMKTEVITPSHGDPCDLTDSEVLSLRKEFDL
jgi:DNA primase